jgi:hypothetical protein
MTMRHDYSPVKRLSWAARRLSGALALLAGVALAVLALAGGAGAHVSGGRASGDQVGSGQVGGGQVGGGQVGGGQAGGGQAGGGQAGGGQAGGGQATSSGCGKAAPEVLAQTIGWVAHRIYTGEVDSSETIKDRLQVETYLPLLHAIAKGDKAAVKTAVTSLVYAHTHIVRLRVLKGSKLLADVGGPYILAPLSGTLSLHGRVIGHYVMSVQDDVGYVKIETRFIGAPVVLRTGAKNVPIEGLVTPGPVKIPEHGPVTYKHVVYQAYSFEANRFPSGPLQISVLVPLPAGLASKPCSVIKNSELAVVAKRISGQLSLSPANFQTYVNLVRTDTNGLLYVRAGSRQLAGSTRPGPTKLPLRGTVHYHRGSYEVFSFQAPSGIGTVRIYALFAQ